MQSPKTNQSTIILNTQRLRLRTWHDNDIAPMTHINNDKRVMEYFPSTQDMTATKALINKIKTHYRKHGFTLYAVDIKDTHTFIGFVGLMTVEFNAAFTPAVEIGWRLSADYWSQGYATEAAKAVLHMAFTELELNEIVSFTAKINLRSQRVMQKIGLLHDDKDDFEHPNIDKHDSLCQHVLYRISRSQYVENNRLP